MGYEEKNHFTLSIYDDLSNCVNTKISTFHKGEYINIFQNNKNYFALVKKGIVSLMGISADGNYYLIEKYTKNDIFTKIWHRQDENELFFVCNSETEIVIIDYLQLLNGCGVKCPRHTAVLTFFMQQILAYTANLNQKLSLLQIKKLEERIMVYFKQQCRSGSHTFTLSCNYRELADYFMVDRASFMRKLKELEDKKIIFRKGKTITLLYLEDRSLY